MDIHEILQEYWGHDRFRDLQEEIINSVLDGKDTLALLPTGGGKSVCFQVPAMAREGICLVISPLIALMKDQVEQLQQRGIPALMIYSGMSFLETKKTLQNAAYGNYKFLYVSPERLETSLFQEYLPAMPVSLLAVDEAHCISQWGYDFRPSYLRIAGIREQLPGVPVLALTASATREVQDDICTRLQFGASQQRFQPSFERPNLSYSVFNAPSKQHKLLEILKNVAGSSIVYCKSRKRTQEITEWLQLNKISAAHYHAGLGHEERNQRQENWISNRTRVIVCTNAFGMGIDKADVRTVIHYDVPDCLENYYQEAGRAGRDGKRSYAVLLYNNRELEELQQQSELRFPAEAEIKKIYISLMNHLQVAAGTGEGQSFDLDLAVFTTAFKLNLLACSYAIKTLEQEAVLSFNEVFFKPSTVVFSSDREELTAFEKQEPALEPLLKGLLRSYEGIFDYPAVIFESRLASQLRMDISALKAGLQTLHERGIIQYAPQKEKPQVLLLQNRMYADSYRINTVEYLKRKQHFEKRIAAIIAYTRETITCRSHMIADYFSAAGIKTCGICDNCINANAEVVTVAEFEKIAGKIFAQISTAPLTIEQLLGLLHDIKKEKLWSVVDFLVAERKIRTSAEGLISLP